MTATALLGDRYALRDQLGAGGTAVVWRAHDSVLGREVAVKLLAARHAGDPESRQRIRAEARAAAALSHPNIAQVYDYGEYDGMPYVVMELVRGGTLQQRMLAGPVPPRFAMRVTAEVAAALAEAHAEGLVHRDIKPANVMLASTGAKVVDFGIAAAVHPGGTGDPDFEVLGTPAYLAPERLVDDAVTPASDVYALGVLLYRLLSGHSPWSADTTTQMLTAHIYLDPEPLMPQPGVPGYITDLCNRCLAKDSTERPSAREVAALTAQAAGVRVVEDAEPRPAAAPAVLLAPAQPERSDQPRQPERQGPSRRRLWPVGAAVLLAAGTLGWLAVRDDEGPAPAPGPPVAAPPPTRNTATASPVVPTSPGATAPGITAPDATAPGATAPVRPAAPVSTRPTRKTPRTTGATKTAPAGESPTPTAPVLREATFISAGGTVHAVCTAPATAELLSWEAAKPYKLDDVNAGPAAAPVCVFRHGNDRVRVTVTCSGGVPTRS